VNLLAVVVAVIVAAGCSRHAAPAPPAAVAPDEPIAEYQEAARAGAAGALHGTVTEMNPKRTGTSDLPLAGTVVRLVPYSTVLRSTLEELKAKARESMPGYRGAADGIRRVRETYEERLWRAGGTDLTLETTADTTGAFLFEAVPQGQWTLYATRAVFVDKPGSAPTLSEQQLFNRRPRLLGFYAVTIWLRDVAMTAGESLSIDLNDRNMWFSGIAEDWELYPRPRQGTSQPVLPGQPPSRR
jgi:hypothetical protein